MAMGSTGWFALARGFCADYDGPPRLAGERACTNRNGVPPSRPNHTKPRPTFPADITAGQDGGLCFVEQPIPHAGLIIPGPGKIGRITSGGTVTGYPISMPSVYVPRLISRPGRMAPCGSLITALLVPARSDG
jgi:hypothetical protein